MKLNILIGLFILIFCISLVSAYDLSYTVHDNDNNPVSEALVLLFSSSQEYSCTTNNNGKCVINNVLPTSQAGYYTLNILKDNYYSKTGTFIYVGSDFEYNFFIEKITENAWPERYILEKGNVFIKLEILDRVREYEEYEFFNSKITLENTGSSHSIDFFDDEFGGVYVKKLNGEPASFGQMPITKTDRTSLSISPGGKLIVTNKENNLEICLTKGTAVYKGNPVTINSLTCLEEEKSYNAIPKGSEGTYYIYTFLRYYENSKSKMIELTTDNFEVKGADSSKKVSPYVNLILLYVNQNKTGLGEKTYLITDKDEVSAYLFVNDLDSELDDLSFEIVSDDFTNIDDYNLSKINTSQYYNYNIEWPYLASDNGKRNLRIIVKDKDGLTDFVDLNFDYTLTDTIDYIPFSIDSKSPSENRIKVKELEEREFSFNISYQYRKPSITWKFNNLEKTADKFSYQFKCGESGLHILKATLSDGKTTLVNDWIIEVEESSKCAEVLNLKLEDARLIQKDDKIIVVMDVVSESYSKDIEVAVNDDIILVDGRYDETRIYHKISKSKLNKGYNEIIISLDPDNKIDEKDEYDNDVILSVFIKDNEEIMNKDIDIDYEFRFNDIPIKDNEFYGKLTIKNKGDEVDVESVQTSCDNIVVENAGFNLDVNEDIDAYVKARCSNSGINELKIKINLEDGTYRELKIPTYVR